MFKKVAIIISPNYQDYAEKYLDDCLESLRKQDYQGEMKIFITDNESNNESWEFLKKAFVQAGYQVIGERSREMLNPDSRFRGNDKKKQDGNSRKKINVEIVRNKNNDGFAKGNNDAMKLAVKEGFDYVILFNMDTIVAPNCVSELAKAAESDNNPPNPPYEGGQPPPIPLACPPEYPARACPPKHTGRAKGGIGAVQARLMLWPEKDKVNSLGNATHFLGFGYCLGYRLDSAKLHIGSTAPAAINNESANIQLLYKNKVGPFDNGRRLWSQRKRQQKNTPRSDLAPIFYPSGAAVLFKREMLEILSPLHPPCTGGQYFDEEFWMYNEDQDLGWRIWLAGYRCVLAPDAVVYHKYQFAKSIKQYYWMDRNRIIAMIKNYRLGTLVLIFPAFVIMELGLILFSLKTGWFKEKMKVWRYFFTPAKWQYLCKARRQTQALRKVKDKDIIDMISGRIWYQEVDDVKLRMINPVFELYWKLVRLVMWW